MKKQKIDMTRDVYFLLFKHMDISTLRVMRLVCPQARQYAAENLWWRQKKNRILPPNVRNVVCKLPLPLDITLTYSNLRNLHVIDGIGILFDYLNSGLFSLNLHITCRVKNPSSSYLSQLSTIPNLKSLCIQYFHSLPFGCDKILQNLKIEKLRIDIGWRGFENASTNIPCLLELSSNKSDMSLEQEFLKKQMQLEKFESKVTFHFPELCFLPNLKSVAGPISPNLDKLLRMCPTVSNLTVTGWCMDKSYYFESFKRFKSVTIDHHTAQPLDYLLYFENLEEITLMDLDDIRPLAGILTLRQINLHYDFTEVRDLYLKLSADNKTVFGDIYAYRVLKELPTNINITLYDARKNIVFNGPMGVFATVFADELAGKYIDLISIQDLSQDIYEHIKSCSPREIIVDLSNFLCEWIHTLMKIESIHTIWVHNEYKSWPKEYWQQYRIVEHVNHFIFAKYQITRK